jgi:hypothetical protein
VKLLTEDAVFKCQHSGVVEVAPTQDYVRIDGRRVLVEDNPEGRDIDWCPNRNLAGIRPCDNSLKVREGYSAFVAIDQHAVCLDNLWGLTDGTPPGAVKYEVRAPGQEYVSGAA